MLRERIWGHPLQKLLRRFCTLSATNYLSYFVLINEWSFKEMNEIVVIDRVTIIDRKAINLLKLSCNSLFSGIKKMDRSPILVYDHKL